MKKIGHYLERIIIIGLLTIGSYFIIINSFNLHSEFLNWLIAFGWVGNLLYFNDFKSWLYKKIDDNMKETKFKTLMYLDMYVDAALLPKGIYTTNKPSIYDKNMTIESLIDTVMIVFSDKEIIKKYCDNIKQCKLVEITLTQGELK